MGPPSSMTELDKFKRRMIRSVARLLLQEKRPEDEVWETLRKETGCDCKLLWERMRALTMKKLKRLLEADDRPDGIAPVARMSLTDWLLFDMVLVHEKIDVIGREKQTMLKVEYRALVQLFSLVQRFNINALSGEKLAEAWSAATIYYNKQGHQCSPMLLQRRWHQLKELTRTNFYNLWQTYRGNDRLWENARRHKPTPLQLAIANCFPTLITHPFPEWEELIQKRLVILPQEFEQKMRRKDLPEPCDENDPDLVLVEPVIESIDLGADSDSESSPNNLTGETTSSTNNAIKTDPIVNLATVKKEPEDEADGLSNVKILAATHIPLEDIITEDLNTSNSSDTYKVNIDIDFTHPEEKRPTEMEQCIESTVESTEKSESPIYSVDDECGEDLYPIIKEKVDKYLAVKGEHLQKVRDDRENELGEETALEGGNKLIEHDAKEGVVIETNEDSYDSVMDDIIKQKAEEFIKKSDVKNPDMLEFEIPSDINFVDDGIEFVDDGIEYVDEDEDISDVLIKIEPEIKEERRESVDNAKFDLKLLMEPVVYTMKLDEMRVFKGNEFLYINDKEKIEQVVAESKPVSKRSIKVQRINETHNYTQLETEESQKSEDEYESEEEISEDQRVKLSSYLLQKPRSRSYNPIQLCKNPDFNTRLKRLTVGFFSSPRNLQLLKACKPLTIDVHKAFDAKLIGGTLYLKSSGADPEQKFVEDDQSKQTVSVLPSAMPVQSLLDNSLPNLITHTTNLVTENLVKNEEIAERNKVINLRDLSEIRKINQRLLTAEVPPLRVQTTYDDMKPLSPRENESVVENTKSLTHSALSPRIPNVEKYVSDNSKSIPVSQCNNENTKHINMSVEDSSDVVPRRRFNKVPLPKYTSLVTRTPVPWNKPKPGKVNDDSEFLITIDTLNKMIHKINGTNLAAQAKNRKGDKSTSATENCQEKTKPNGQQLKRKPRRRKLPATKTVKRTCKGKATIVLSDEESDEKLRNAVESIERVVQDCDVPKPVVRVYSVSKVVDDASINISQHSPPINSTCDTLLNSVQIVAKTVDVATDTDKDLTTTDYTHCRGLPLSVENVTSSSTNLLNTVPTVTPQELTDPAPQIRVKIQPAQPPTPKPSPQTQTVPLHQNIFNQIRPQTQWPVKKTTVWPFPKQNSPKHIVIDGSKPCPIPKIVVDENLPKNDKQMLLLNTRNITPRAVESPIYLGKDKILLTTVKLPNHSVKSDLVDCVPKVIPTHPLPEGVSLVLMPNGELIYTVEPGVQLSEDQLALLPTITAAVMQQINSKTLPSMNAPTISASQDDVIKLSDDETSPNEIIDKSISEKGNSAEHTIKNVEMHSNVDKSNNLLTNTLDVGMVVKDHTNNESQSQSSTDEPEKEINNDLNKIPPVTAFSAEQSLKNCDTELVDESQVTSEKIPEKTNDPKENLETVDSNSGSRNLLSDLMEMSGISPEDTVPIEPTNMIPEVIVPPNVLQPAHTIVPIEPANMIPEVIVPPNMLQPHTITNNEFVNLPELSPITSLAELKYACEQNGKFFKLDFTTGVLVPINVCIKKSPKSTGKRSILNHSAPESVIDLTDDVEYSFETETSTSPSKEVSPLKNNNAVSPQKNISDQNQLIKPVKLFKACPTPIILNKQFLKQDSKLTKLHPKKRRRKQSLKNLSNKIEAKIDLVDSDAPMEEEYLLESSDSGDETLNKQKSSYININTGNINSQSITTEAYPPELSRDGSEDSDDEPLAKISKRIRVTDNKNELGGEVSADLNKHPESSVEERENYPETTSIEPTKVISETPCETMETEPVAASVTEIDFLEGVVDEDEAQEDCILGF